MDVTAVLSGESSFRHGDGVFFGVYYVLGGDSGQEGNELPGMSGGFRIFIGDVRLGEGVGVGPMDFTPVGGHPGETYDRITDGARIAPGKSMGGYKRKTRSYRIKRNPRKLFWMGYVA